MFLFFTCLFATCGPTVVTSLVMQSWNYLDFTNPDNSMYGVLDCCTHSNMNGSNNKLLGSFYDYLFPPVRSYSTKTYDLALHMGMAPCMAVPSEPENVVATTVTKSRCLVESPNRRLMIVDAAFRYAQYETQLLKSTSASLKVPLDQCRVTRIARSTPMGMFYVAWSAYRYNVNATRYCVPHQPYVVTAEYGATIDRHTVRGDRLTCDDVTNDTISCPEFGPTYPHYNMSIVWPSGYAETPSFKGSDFTCRRVPSQSIYTAIHMYPALSSLALTNMALFKDVRTLAAGSTCGYPTDARERGLCLLHRMYKGYHPIVSPGFGGLSPYFGCLKSFITGRSAHAYPKCIGDLNEIRTSFGTYELTIVPKVTRATTGGFHTTSVQTVGTGCVIPPLPDKDLQPILEHILLCDKVLVVLSSVADVNAAIVTLETLSNVYASLGVQVPGNLASALPAVMSRLFAEVSKTTIKHVTVDLTASAEMCVLEVLEGFETKTVLGPFKKQFPSIKVALKISGRHLACLHRTFETDRSISGDDVDNMLIGVSTVIVSVSTSRTHIPFMGNPPMPQCPSLWKSRTRSKWLWSPDSNVGPYVTEPTLAAGVSQATLGVVTIPNAMALFGPERLVVELDTGCTLVHGKPYTSTVVTKCERRMHHSVFDRCAPEFGRDCCGIKVEGGYVFIQPLNTLQSYVTELMKWGVRHVEFGDIRDVTLDEGYGDLTVLDILTSMLTPQPLVYTYTLRKSNANNVFCPGVIRATAVLFFQTSNLPYSGFYTTTKNYPNVGLTTNEQLCRARTSAHVQAHTVAVIPDKRKVKGAYYLDTLDPVDFVSFRDAHFVYVSLNDTVIVYVPTVIPGYTYSIGDYGNRLPSTDIQPSLLDIIGPTTNRDIVYINTRRKTALNNLGNASVAIKYEMKHMTIKTSCVSPFVCDVQKENQYVDFMAFRNASVALYGYLGKPIPPVTYIDNLVNATVVIETRLSAIAMILTFKRSAVPVITSYVLNRLGSVLFNGHVIRMYRNAGNALACMFGSTIGCWALVGLPEVMVTGNLLGVLDTSTNVTLSIQSVLDSEWVLSYKQVLPLSNIKPDPPCFTTKDVELMIYPREEAVTFGNYPWGDVGQDSWYVCARCVNDVCLNKDMWEIHTDYGTLATRTIPYPKNDVPILRLANMYTYVEDSLAIDWAGIAVAVINTLKMHYNKLVGFNMDAIRDETYRVSSNISTQFINKYKESDTVLLTNVSSCFISAVAIVISVGLCVISIVY